MSEKNWKNEYVKLRKAVNKYLRVNGDMVDWMHYHLMSLCDEQVKEYEELCEANDEAASNL